MIQLQITKPPDIAIPQYEAFTNDVANIRRANMGNCVRTKISKTQVALSSKENLIRFANGSHIGEQY